MLEEGLANVKGISERSLKKYRNLCNLSLVFDLDGVDHFEKMPPKYFINFLLVP